MAPHEPKGPEGHAHSRIVNRHVHGEELRRVGDLLETIGSDFKQHGRTVVDEIEINPPSTVEYEFWFEHGHHGELHLHFSMDWDDPGHDRDRGEDKEDISYGIEDKNPSTE